MAEDKDNILKLVIKEIENSKAEVASLMGQVPEMLEIVAVQAKYQKERYYLYYEDWFTSAQAIEQIKCL